MWKLGLLRAAITSNVAARMAVAQNRTLPSVLYEPARRFSTEAEKPPQDSGVRSASGAFAVRSDARGLTPIDPLLNKLTSRMPQTFLIPISKLAFTLTFDSLLLFSLGISRNTLKTDIVNMLEGCNLRLEDVKVVQFQSWKAFDNATRVISRKGRLYKLERANRSQWDNLTSHDGKTVRIPQTAAPEDVGRFLSGCEYNSSSFQIIFRCFPEPFKFVTVCVASQTEAMNAFLAKNKGFCQNG
ncbi:hypothetical protein D8674_008273 [Pyrus ussuriensis x Pyrus communis]|uniref:Uncharacterized protein n=1 Tax=Pyrus ussuriensis x Pyrus communis TaxID=2448454 RepID=A0A5N5I571_9ROSA|nr:hypothetical protein D8674_008273 [Pyrus ussuriensis x Pyrus communis]